MDISNSKVSDSHSPEYHPKQCRCKSRENFAGNKHKENAQRRILFPQSNDHCTHCEEKHSGTANGKRDQRTAPGEISEPPSGEYGIDILHPGVAADGDDNAELDGETKREPTRHGCDAASCLCLRDVSDVYKTRKLVNGRTIFFSFIS